MIMDTSAKKAQTIVRCAIYCRKSTQEGLDQDFNSLDAQREAAEAYINSQKHEGWCYLPDRYDDGGFTGGNIDRPAFKRLMADVEVGKIDAVVVYKVDRLSRSLIDFIKIMEVFDKHDVSFVSVTQNFNTKSSMGRLVLNILLSFAQFEREIISERTRDKIAASRRKGKWTGGNYILGYDLDKDTRKLKINEEEADQVKSIFNLYLEKQSLTSVVRELNRKRWTTKCWINRKGKWSGGSKFNKTNLHGMLTNVIYIGKIKHIDQVYNGEHDAIISEGLFEKVQISLEQNKNKCGTMNRSKYKSLLRGLLYCESCGTAMMHTYSKKRNKQYSYYVCQTNQKRGRTACTYKSLPAHEIEKFVIDRIRLIGQDEEIIESTLVQARKQYDDYMFEFKVKLDTQEQKLQKCNQEIQKIILSSRLDEERDTSSMLRLAELQETIINIENTKSEVRREMLRFGEKLICKENFKSALELFDPVWNSLKLGEQARLLNLLIEKISYNSKTGKVSITFFPAGIKTLAQDINYNRKGG